MTKEEFKLRWESDEDGGGITFNDMADCAIKWGICSSPKAKPMHTVAYSVLLSAGVKDAEEYKPSKGEDHE